MTAKQGHLLWQSSALEGPLLPKGHFPVLPRGYHSTDTLSGVSAKKGQMRPCLPVTQDKQQAQKWEELGGSVKLKRFNPSQLNLGSSPLNQKLPRRLLPVGYSAGQGLTRAVLTSGQPDTDPPHLKVCFQTSAMYALTTRWLTLTARGNWNPVTCECGLIVPHTQKAKRQEHAPVILKILLKQTQGFERLNEN